MDTMSLNKSFRNCFALALPDSVPASMDEVGPGGTKSKGLSNGTVAVASPGDLAPEINADNMFNQEITQEIIAPHATEEQIGNTRVNLIHENRPSVRTVFQGPNSLTLGIVSETIVSSDTSATKATSETPSLFDARLPSALKVTDSEIAKKILLAQIKQGWRWLAPNWLASSFSEENDQVDPVVRAKQMPELSRGDWVIMEGKTMRLIPAISKDDPSKTMCKRLERELATSPRNAANNSSVLTDKFSSAIINNPITALYPGDLPINFFENSYVRLAGAYIRHLERLPKLQQAFDRFFATEEKKSKHTLSVRTQEGYKLEDAASYNQFLSVKLKNDPLTQDDLILIRQALGISIDVNSITDHSTIANTIPFKKVLEMLTCFDTVKYADCPWYVQLTLFGGERSFLLSKGTLETTDKQLTVSMRRPSNDKVNLFIVTSYPYWMQQSQKLVAEAAIDTLNHPLSHSTVLNDDWKSMLEFIVHTQVVEAHCASGYLTKSRVPGAGKQARAILQHHIADNTPLRPSFDMKRDNQRMFPMAGTDGTGSTRLAINDLTRPDKKAPCTDMSDDSDLEEISEAGISGEGKNY